MTANQGDAPLRLMHVHAHPDDESSKGAASTAKYVAEGVEVHVVTCTGGERGSVLNPRYPVQEMSPEDMTTARRSEMDEAAGILGVTHHWLGFVDSGLPEGDPLPPLPAGCFALVPTAEAAERLAALIDQIRPHVMTTYDENGGYPHPDHVKCHDVTMQAFHTAEWRAPKLYYHHESRLREPTTRIECADFRSIRDAALLAHATQIEPGGWWFRGADRPWPTDDFELVTSSVATSLPEDDLFAGLR